MLIVENGWVMYSKRGSKKPKFIGKAGAIFAHMNASKNKVLITYCTGAVELWTSTNKLVQLIANCKAVTAVWQAGNILITNCTGNTEIRSTEGKLISCNIKHSPKFIIQITH